MQTYLNFHFIFVKTLTDFLQFFQFALQKAESTGSRKKKNIEIEIYCTVTYSTNHNELICEYLKTFLLDCKNAWMVQVCVCVTQMQLLLSRLEKRFISLRYLLKHGFQLFLNKILYKNFSNLKKMIFTNYLNIAGAFM